MTLFRYSRPDKTGIDRVVAGVIEFALVNREEVDGRFRTQHVFSAPLDPFQLEDGQWVGQADVTLPTTGPTQGVRVRERLSPNVGGRSYTVVVPNPAPVFATDLVEVDPTTLVPSTDSIPAWEAVTESMAATLTGAQNAASQAESSAITANASAGAASDSAAFAASVAAGATASVDAAAQSASDAAGSATASATSATEAADSATAAEVARQAAEDATAGIPTLATVAITGAYSDLTGKPTIPATPEDIGAQPAGSYATTTALTTGLAGKADLVGGVVPTSQIPALALTNTVSVASQAAMLALSAGTVQPGDIAVRTDGAGTFVLTATDPSVIGNWTRLNAPTDVVTSVNGQQGTVVLAKGDVGLGNVNNTADSAKPVSTAQQTALDAKADLAAVPELARDAIGSALVAGGGVTVTANDAGDTITVASPAPLTLMPRIGQYVQPPGMLSASNGAPVNQRLSFSPFHVGPQGWTLDAFRIAVGVAAVGGAGLSFNCGLYADDGTGWPDASQQLAVGTASDFVLTSTGNKTSVLATPLVLKPGLYWIATLYQYTTVPTTALQLGCFSNVTWQISLPSSTTLGTTLRGITVAGLTALPTAAIAEASFNISGSTDCPLVGLRRSA